MISNRNLLDAVLVKTLTGVIKMEHNNHFNILNRNIKTEHRENTALLL